MAVEVRVDPARIRLVDQPLLPGAAVRRRAVIDLDWTMV
jgi:hypothetical protein